MKAENNIGEDQRQNDMERAQRLRIDDTSATEI